MLVYDMFWGIYSAIVFLPQNSISQCPMALHFEAAQQQVRVLQRHQQQQILSTVLDWMLCGVRCDSDNSIQLSNTCVFGVVHMCMSVYFPIHRHNIRMSVMNKMVLMHIDRTASNIGNQQIRFTVNCISVVSMDLHQNSSSADAVSVSIFPFAFLSLVWALLIKVVLASFDWSRCRRVHNENSSGTARNSMPFAIYK